MHFVIISAMVLIICFFLTFNVKALLAAIFSAAFVYFLVSIYEWNWNLR